MRVAIALGGTALVHGAEALTADDQRASVRAAAPALAAVAWNHQLILAHGSGPCGTTSDGMVGYVLEQELANLLPVEVPFATLLTMVEVDPVDPAFDDPVPAPEPQRILEIRPIRWLLDKGAVVICAGGGGIATMYTPDADRGLTGVEAVIDADLASELLAREVAADVFVMVTDVDGVYADWGSDDQRRLGRVTPDELRRGTYAAGSMGSKVEAAIRFVERTGKRAAIGGLAQVEEMVDGGAGTQVVPAGGTRLT